MKKFFKMIASAAVCAAMVSMTALSAGAVDYAEDPDYEEPAEITEGAGLNADAPTDIVTDDIVSEALKSDEPVVYIESDTAVVKEDAIGEIASGDTPVTFDAGDYSVTVDPALITEVTAIDLAMDISVVKQDSVDGVELNSTAIVIKPAQKGEFGMTLAVTIPTDKVKEIDTKSLFVYYVSDDGDVKLLENALTVNTDGSITIAISHASSYVITDEPIATTADSEVDGSEADDTNPSTGVAFAGTAVLALISTAAVATTAKKRK